MQQLKKRFLNFYENILMHHSEIIIICIIIIIIKRGQAKE